METKYITPDDHSATRFYPRLESENYKVVIKPKAYTLGAECVLYKKDDLEMSGYELDKVAIHNEVDGRETAYNMLIRAEEARV